MPQTIHVSASANASIANGSTLNPYATIQAAINAAQNGDTILLGDGTYKGVGNRDLSLSGKSVTLVSQNGPEKTIVDAERSGRFFTIAGGVSDTVEIRGISFKGGYFTHGGDWTGQGLTRFETDAPVSIKDCKFTESEILASYVTSGSKMVQSVGKGKVTLENVLIDSNKIGGGDTGGRAYVIEGNVDVLKSSVTNNTIFTSADRNGWGGDIRATMILSPGSRIENSVIYGNSPAKVDWKAWGSVPLIAQADVYVGGEDPNNLPDGSVVNSVVQGVLFAKTKQGVFTDAPQNHPEWGYSDEYQSVSLRETVTSSVTYTLQDGEKHLLLTGDAVINGTGNELNNSITGNNAANLLDGGAGNDTLQGGGGNDTLVGGEGDDVIVASGSAAQPLKLEGWATGDNTFALYKGDINGNNLSLIVQDSDRSWGTNEPVGAFSLDAGEYLYAIVLEERAPTTGFIADLGSAKTSDLAKWKVAQGTFSPSRSSWFDLPTLAEIKSAISAASWSDSSSWNKGANHNGMKGVETPATQKQTFGIARYSADFPNAEASSGNNSLSGGAGNDIMQGGGGNDTLIGGDGNDLLVAGGVTVGSKYEVVEGSFTWDEAKTDAEARGGHLATFSSEAEWNAAQVCFPTSGEFWLGATDSESEGDWLWIDGTPWAFTQWSPSNPNDDGNQDVLDASKSESDPIWQWDDDWRGDYVWGARRLSAYVLEVDGATLSNSGNNSLSGGTGSDTLQGALGNDTLDGGTGVDALVGGAGDDLYLIDNAADAITENANEGTDTVRSSVSRTLGANIENLELLGASAINATGNASANILTGNAAANQLNGGAGADTLRGGAGNDTYSVDNTGDVIIEAANAGTDVVQSAGSYILGTNVENLTLTGASAINGTGNALANQITGNAAANRISAGAGNDSILAGAGNDTLNAGVGLDTVKGEAGTDFLQIDWTSLAGATITRNIRKDGAGAAASFSGSYVAKNASGTVLSQVTFDTIERLTLNGQAVDLEKAVAIPGVTIKRTSTATATTEQGGTVEYSVVLDKAPFENVTLNFASSDTTEGKVNTPSLTFSPQNWSTPQALVVQGVNDYLNDGNVAYTIRGTVSTTDLTYNRIEVPAINLLNNDDGRDRNQNLYGTEDTDYLEGMDGHDRIYGKGGQDQIKGGIGDDRLYGQEDDDRLFGETGNDELYGGYDDDTLDGGIGSDSLFGELGRDTLLGGAGNDYLNGGDLNDSMSGGAGNDTYFVDSAGDQINDLGLTTDVDTVLVLQTINYTLPANVENAAINATGNANLTGNGLNNGLTGNADKNILDGGSGNDKLDGGAGADSLFGGVGNDALLGGLGNDTMRGGDGVDLADFAAAGVDIRVDLSTGRVTGEGTDLLFDIENILAGEGQDTLLGNTAGNDLDGGAGIDSLNGGGGNDTLAGCFFGANGGRSEIDTLAGGVGNDIFQLGWSSWRFYDDGVASNAGRGDYVLITDFTVGQDKLQLDGASSNYYLGASGVTGVGGTGLWAEQGATDELIAIIRSANTTTLNATNTVNTGLFV